ncbi:amidase family protein [Bradyrhizobium erythrophlei]|jgi:aspartyl-tRNA(Asn)/glutamyl-tRNA(Gln) amidotransferase subunit A|uniref:Indoleacetamide hydrolase n=1 Tax=Bradyrhizobium erythrophlei TaxID=1437360 RepID=A0A1M5SF46_9BRAD|nr:amidase family protein [Bradyrhizobium erythrophlei]SHH37099.1 aspartyl-tRNA(Asn)/glutamyl-tRNA(Gln) amidotransferase subunit A [Bradyrhizobium erythrophlei]
MAKTETVGALGALCATHEDDEIAFLDALALARAYINRDLSPVEVAGSLLDRIERLNSRINAIVHLDREKTLEMARAAERRYAAGNVLSPLDGVPVTVKDLSSIAGWPRRRGSLAFDGLSPCAEDTPCVARLREAGAVLLGKTATPDSGCKVVTRSAVHGVTLNPYDLTKTPGGSSGGASAALAMGFGPLAVGSDGAGSIRIPASLTNVFGLKPGFGRVPAFPPDIDMPHSVVGPMSRSVRDAAVMLAVMCRPERRDPFAWPVPFFVPDDLADPDLRELAVAISPRMGCKAPLEDREVDELVLEAIPPLTRAGARVLAEDPAWPVDPVEPFQIFWDAGCAATLDGFAVEKRSLLDPTILKAAEAGRKVTISAYQRAMEQRLEITAASRAFFNRFDLLVCPVVATAAWPVAYDVPEGFADDDWRWCPYTFPWNMTGQPAASVPVGFTAAGLPVGVQIVGPWGGEENVLRAAAAIERRRSIAK